MKRIAIISITLSLLSFASFSAQAQDNEFWTKCKKNSDCALAKNKACGVLCYNKKYEKEAFEWERRIVWECITPSRKERHAVCENKRCNCVEKN